MSPKAKLLVFEVDYQLWICIVCKADLFILDLEAYLTVIPFNAHSCVQPFRLFATKLTFNKATHCGSVTLLAVAGPNDLTTK